MSTESDENIILFIHTESKACQKLQPLLPKDKKIQILDISQINNLPPQITSVPAVILNNKDILVGKKVFDFFNKTDDMEYINFNTKNGFNIGSSFSSINDDNVASSNYFSTIDSDSISVGIPEWKGEGEGGKTLDLDRLQAERAELDLGPTRQ